MKYSVINKAYLSWLKNIRENFHNSKNNIFKSRNEIKILSFQEKNMVVKSFKIPHFINKIAYTFFRSSKAKKSYFNSIKLTKFAPKPIGYIEFTKFGLIDDSYFVCKEFSYDFTIREPLLDNNFKNKKRVLEEFAFFTYKLHEEGIEHLDYSPGNILIKKEDRGYLFKIVDVNRMKFRALNLEQRLKNFSKLWATDEDLKIIIESYAKYIKMDKNDAIKIALQASHKHKYKKNMKKRLKGIEVVD